MKQFIKLGILSTIVVAPAFVIFSFTGTALNTDVNEFSNDKNLITVKHSSEMSIFKLWQDDIDLSNSAVICFNESDVYTQESITLLCRNKVNLCAAIQSNYGKKTRTKFAALLEAHNLATFDLVIALHTKNIELIATSTKNWIENNEEIFQLIEKSETENRLFNMSMKMNNHLRNDSMYESNFKYKVSEEILFNYENLLEDSIPSIVIIDTMSTQTISDTSANRFENHKFKIVVKKNTIN